MRQLNLFEKPSLKFGGSPETPHVQRTLSDKRTMHLVLKCHDYISLFKEREKITAILTKQASTFGIQIYTWSVQHDHIHISLKIPDRAAYKKWIRATTGLIARRCGGKGLWKFRPFTRILGGSPKEFWALNNYIFRNEMEVFKIWNYDRAKSIEDMAAVTKGRIIQV